MASHLQRGQATAPTAVAGRSLPQRILALATGKAALVAALLVAESFFLFASLDNAYLSIGEGNTARLARNVLEYGYPRAWDGSYLVVPFYESTVNEDLAWVSHPWLQYYLAAAGLAVFGDTSLGARFFFGLCGLLSLLALYALTARMSGDERLAWLATLLLGLHPLFWFYSRQSRYYAPTILLMLLVTLAYLKWRESERDRHLAAFVSSSALLFYSLYTIWAFVMLAIGLHYLAFGLTRRTLPAFALSALLIGCLTLPFFLYAPPHFHLDLPPTGEGYGTRLAVHLWKVQTLYYPLLTLPLVWLGARLAARLKARLRPGRGGAPAATGLAWRNEYWLGLSVVAYVFFIVVYPFFTTHYMLPVLPAGAVLTAFLVLKLRAQSRWLAAPVLALLLATNLLHVLPYIVADKLGARSGAVEALMPNPTWTHRPGTPLAHYITEHLAVRFYAFDFLDFLGRDYRHQLREVVTFIERNARPGETVAVPWNDADAVAFYTGRPIAYHLDTSSYRNAELKRLAPRAGNADWIVPLTFDLPPIVYLSEQMYRDYERVKIFAPKEYFETYPNIDFFNFRTNQAAPPWFYILRRRAEEGSDAKTR